MSADDPAPRPHRRRERYPGKNPRRFEHKYKELDPARHPEIVAHVRARGGTPAGQHVSILVAEVLAALAPAPGERGVDATLGYGGHAEAFLAALRPGGTLLGVDQDPIELPRAAARLAALGHGPAEFVARRTNFAGLQRELAELGWDGVDFVFADLGVSSMQIDDPARGFTFKHAGPLDMRMNPRRGLSAAEWLARTPEADIAAALDEFADEPRARLVARALAARRGSLATTAALAEVVRDSLAGVRVDESEIERAVRRVFQAVRIAVNDELGVLDALLRALPELLRARGRAAILTFHSGEDRRVKQAFERGLAAGVYSAIAPEVVRASSEERRANPRSASAKLRWARRA